MSGPLRHLAARLVGVVLAGAASLANAQEEPGGIPPGRVCLPEADPRTDRRRFDPVLLARLLLEEEPVSDLILDRNADGDTLLQEKRLAMVDPGYCDLLPCSAEDEAALADLRARLDQWVEAEGGPRFDFERLRRPTLAERSVDPALSLSFEDPDQRFHVGEVLDPAGRFVEVVCLPPEPDRAVAGQEPVPEIEPDPRWVRDPYDDEGIRLTGEIDDLSKDRQNLSSVRPAEFSISANLLDDETVFFVDAIGGYLIDIGRGDEVRLVSIPFVLLERLFTDEEDRIDKLGAGWQGSARLPLTAIADQEYAITPVYLTDSDLETDIFSLKLRWTPTLEEGPRFPLGFFREFGGLRVLTSVDLLTDAGKVFENAENLQLLSENRFLRVGGRLRLSVRGAADTLLERIQFDLADTYLYNIGSDIEHINLLEVGFSYLLPGRDNYRLSFSFTGGRDRDTLNEKAFWKTQVGVRF